MSDAGAGTATLEIENLGVAFRVSGLHQVNLTVRPGHVHALPGENGAGKSTLIKVVTGAQKPHHGHVARSGGNVAAAGS